jgi:hypothetical protein
LRTIKSLRTLGALAGLALAVSSCAVGPRYPLYSPLAVAGLFGYEEQRLSDTEYTIRYSAPIEVSFNDSRVQARRSAQRLVVLSHDLALRRAAALTLDNGFAYFIQTGRENDVEIGIERDYGGRYPGGGYYRRFPYRFGLPPAFYDDRTSRVAVTVKIDIRMLIAPEPGAFDARELADEMARKYPDDEAG